MPSSVTYVRPTVNLVRGADCTICTGPLLEAIAVAALDRGATQAPDAQSPRQVAGRSRRSLDRARHTRSRRRKKRREGGGYLLPRFGSSSWYRVEGADRGGGRATVSARLLSIHRSKRRADVWIWRTRLATLAHTYTHALSCAQQTLGLSSQLN